MKVVGIIQARMGSTRLPGKVLLEIEGRSMLRHIVERCKASRHLDIIAIATTTQPLDDEIEQYAQEELEIAVCRGSVDDVLARYYHCARQMHADIIVRITADDPLKDGEIIDRAIQALLDDPELEYCSNTMEPTFPEGFDIEVFRFSALETAHKQAKLLSEREHVTPFIWKHGERFKCHNFTHEENLSDWRLTVDKPQDLELIREIFRELGRAGNLFSYKEVISLIKQRPELLDINKGTVRNEGYLRSVGEEKP